MSPPEPEGRTPSLTVEVVVPVYNEQPTLIRSVTFLHGRLAETLPYEFRIVIADNASTDGTPATAEELCRRLDGVHLLRLEQKGRGRALRTAWMTSRADVLSYMDVDLSTDLGAFPELIGAIAEDGFDVAIGRRLGPGAVVRGRRLTREVTSRGYNVITRLALGTDVVDAQCGFKAISRVVAERVLPEVVDDQWFFDTELLIRAERSGYRIKQVPVNWTDDPHSHVKIIGTAIEDLKGIWRLSRQSF